VNETRDTGDQARSAPGDSAGTPGSGQGPAAPRADNPANGDVSDPRRTAHELVAQAQALLHIASEDSFLDFWWPAGVPDVRPTFPELGVKAGLVQAEIASGLYDDRLADSVGNPLGRPKANLLRRLHVRIQNFVRGEQFQQAAKFMKPACGIASSALGSMSFIPGAGAIKEGIDIIASGLETVKGLSEEDLSGLPDKPEQPVSAGQPKPTR
jgi:hypothetical protein